jgi:ribosomal protein S19
MGRSKWKGPYLNYKSQDTNKQKNVFLRNSEILPQFIGNNLKVHNGKSYSEILITNEMVNHKIGEFIFTRGKFSFKKKNK